MCALTYGASGCLGMSMYGCAYVQRTVGYMFDVWFVVCCIRGLVVEVSLVLKSPHSGAPRRRHGISP